VLLTLLAYTAVVKEQLCEKVTRATRERALPWATGASPTMPQYIETYMILQCPQAAFSKKVHINN
jgi:hypothetical protein